MRQPALVSPSGLSRRTALRRAGAPVPPALGRGSTGTVRNVGQESVIAYVVTLEPAGAEGGTPPGGTPAS